MSEDYLKATVKIAVFESSGHFSYQSLYTEAEADSTDMTRISDWASVDFVRRSREEEIIQEKVAKLDKEIDNIKSFAMEQVSRLTQRKQELLSLSYAPDQCDPTAEPDSADDIPF